MDRQLAKLSRQLERAAAESDWSALGALDRELAGLLRTTASRQWTPKERSALEALHRAHTLAREHCERETTRMDGVLSQMREHKDGWMAYAMSNESDEVRT